tara:strand:+ start:174 stop:572 length:399 start_codon:yes stop_codon:yes gene_type:complete
VKSKSIWSEYKFLSSLQLKDFLDILLEPLTDNEDKDQIKLGLHEALINAVQHGNFSDPQKHVRVRRVVTPKWFIWQIHDQGEGLLLNKRLPILPSQESVGGRGLFIIHHCFDDVRWSQKGNRLQLAIKRFSD